MVSIDDIMTAVNIALGGTDVLFCLPADVNTDSAVTVDEILAGIDNALNGCRQPTPTATGTGAPPVTQTATPTASPLPTTTQGTVPRRAAGSTVALTQALRAIPAIISSLAPIAHGGGAASEGGAAAVKSCTGGGTSDFTCAQAVSGVPPRNYNLTLSTCTLPTTAGSTVTVNGAITAQSTESGFLATCGFPPLALSSFTVSGLQITAASGGTTTLNATVDVSGSLTITPDVLASCKIAAVDMTLTGTIAVTTATLTETLTFSGTEVRIDVDQFNDDCVPVVYRITLNGEADLSDGGGGTFSGNFTDFVFRNDTTSGVNVETVNGAVDSSCFGTQITLATLVSLSVPQTAICPTAGAVRVTTASATDRVVYTPSGVEIDLGDNGTTDESFGSCIDTPLLTCSAG